MPEKANNKIAITKLAIAVIKTDEDIISGSIL